MDRPSGAYIQDPKTGEITPDLSDEAMRNRQPADENPSPAEIVVLHADQPKEPGEPDETGQPDKRKRR